VAYTVFLRELCAQRLPRPARGVGAVVVQPDLPPLLVDVDVGRGHVAGEAGVGQRQHARLVGPPGAGQVVGVGQPHVTAIVVGDALQTLAQEVLLEAHPVRGPQAAAALSSATAEMVAGQADDIAFETRADVTVEQCTAMSAAKTGAILGCAASIGAILAGAPAATIGALRDYGRHLGLAFQAVATI